MSKQQELICLSSSEDEDTSRKIKKNVNEDSKQIKFKQKKRKLSISSSVDDGDIKRRKNQDKQIISNNIRHQNTENSSHFDSCKKITKSKGSVSLQPECGTSKYFDEMEKEVSNNTEITKVVESRFSLPPGTSKQSTPARKVIKPQLVVKEKVSIPDPSDDVFQRFVEACKKKSSDEATKKVIMNLKNRYSQLDHDDKSNDEFRLFLNASIQKIANAHSKFYSLIQEVRNEIKRRINIKKTNKKSEEVKQNENRSTVIEEPGNAENHVDGMELSEEVWRKVKKLEDTIKKCKDKIHELDNEEVDFNDEENSSYLKKDRYERKIVQLCAELSKLVKDEKLKREIYKKLLRRKDIPGEMTGITLIDEAIINFVNTSIKKVNKLKHVDNFTALPDYLNVPDHCDILQCIYKCNDEQNLNLTKNAMELLALNAFKTIGRYLKNWRIKESEQYLSSYVELEDPALKNPELHEKLKKSKKEGDKKLEEIFKKFVEKQEGLSLEDLGKEEEEEEISASDESVEDEADENDKDQEKIKNNSGKNKENKENTDTKVKPKEDNGNEKHDIQDSKNDAENALNDSTSSKDLVINQNDYSEKEVNNLDVTRKIQNAAKEDKSVENCIREKVSMNNESNHRSSAGTILINDNSKALTILSEICGLRDDVKSFNNVLSNIVTGGEDEIQILSDHEIVNVKDSEQMFPNENDDLVLEDNVVDIDKDPLNIDIIDPEDKSEITSVSPILGKDSTIKGLHDVNKLKNKSEIRSLKSDENNEFMCISKDDVLKNPKASNYSEDKNKSRTVVGEISAKDVTTTIDSLHKTQEIVTSIPTDNITRSSKEVVTVQEIKKKTFETRQSEKVVDIIELIELVTPKGTPKGSQEVNCEDIQSVDKETTCSADEAKPELDESSFIKVRSFAKPPESWKDNLSPEKTPKNLKLPIQQVLKDMPKPECVDLTNEKEASRSPSSNTRCINPVAINKRRMSMNNVIIVRNQKISHNISSQKNDDTNAKSVTQKNARFDNRPKEKSVTFSTNSTNRPQANISQTLTNNNQRRNQVVARQVLKKPVVLVLPYNKEKG